jgi:hypothetical protein
MRKILAAIPLFLLAGCAGFLGKPSPVVEVGERDMVKDCQLLTTFRKPAGDWMWGTPYIGCFKNEAIEKAEKMGASHILTRYDIDEFHSELVVYAYKCPPDHDAWLEMQKEKEEEY